MQVRRVIGGHWENASSDDIRQFLQRRQNSSLSLLRMGHSRPPLKARPIRPGSSEWGLTLVLDSGSTDDTVAIARKHGARIAVHPFDDYGPQKQRAYDMASHDWILNLDADEILSPGTREEIERALQQPTHAGFRLPRRERMFWTVQHRWSWRNGHLRLFDRRRGGMNDVDVHAAVEVRGPVKTLRRADFINDGDGDIATRVEKINRYTTGMVAYKLRTRQRFTGLRMVFYPPVFFLRQYVGKRYFLNGRAGALWRNLLFTRFCDFSA